MIVKEINERVVLWGYATSKDKKKVMGQLAFVASNVFNPVIELENGVKAIIPSEYLGRSYPTALAYLTLEVAE